MFDAKYPEPDPNKKPAKEVWEARYAGDSYLFGKEPSAFLKSYVGSLRKGKALDIAMGEGRNAVFLAQQGFQVAGLDCSPAAVEKAKKLAAEKNVQIDAKAQNLDFFLMPLMGYDTVLMTYFRPLSRFFNEVRRGLVTGGTFLLEAYTTEHYKKQSPPNPILDYEECYHPNEVLKHLKDLRVLYYKEMQEGNQHLVQVIAQKVNV
ncbi:MAG: class I SAM-dependent methyltransferase [Bdellovibrionales bacterium]|nr:class I SAM-dependent methyltransferase [Bdellovibrionales bacterium]